MLKCTHGTKKWTKKRNAWDSYYAVDVIYQGKTVGFLSVNLVKAPVVWQIYLRFPASEESLAASPDCQWTWYETKTAFSTAAETKAWLNENRGQFIPQLYFEPETVS